MGINLIPIDNQSSHNLVFTQNTGTVQGAWCSFLEFPVQKASKEMKFSTERQEAPTWVTYQTVSAESVTITNLQTGTNYDFRVRTMAAIDTKMDRASKPTYR